MNTQPAIEVIRSRYSSFKVIYKERTYHLIGGWTCNRCEDKDLHHEPFEYIVDLPIHYYLCRYCVEKFVKHFREYPDRLDNLVEDLESLIKDLEKVKIEYTIIETENEVGKDLL